MTHPSALAAPPPDLKAGCQALGLGLSADQLGLLVRFMALLQQWNRTYNLTAVRDPEKMLTHHLLDSLAVVGPLRRQLAELQGRRLLDVGSGAGLPGIVLAIAEPSLQVVCVDSVGKKAAFMQQVASDLQLGNLQSLHSRVEDIRSTQRFDIIASRAFASLFDFVRLTRPLLNGRGVWLAMKGRLPDEELAGLPEDVVMFHVEQIDVPFLNAERRLVWMKALH